MKKMMTAVTLLGLSLPLAAQAMEFQTPGALGLGRAGVARTTDANATFINPAGLAFYKNAFNMKLGAGAGVAISSTLADDMDKVGKLGLNGSNMTYATGASAADVAAATTKAAQFAGLLSEVDKNKGDLAINVDLNLAFQFRNYGLGILGVSELGAGVGTVDTTNIRAGNATASTVTSLSTDLGVVSGAYAGNGSQATYFSQSLFDQVALALSKASGSATVTTQAQDLTATLEAKLKAGGVNVTGMTPDQIAQGLVTIAPSLGTTAGTIDQNNTTVLLRGIAVAEVPLAYGHKFDFGNYGKLGVGGAAKVMRGTVYSSDVKIMKLKDSKDATTQVKDNHAESTQFGLDLGALWRLEDVKYVGPINVGLALKNINTPKFDGPKDVVTGAGTDKVKVEPQARLGVALDPLSWLSIAADMDLTKNKTTLPTRDSQLFGGGIEAHFDHWYALWLALRLGAYKNIADSGSKPVITGGFSLGPQYCRFDLNAAVATETGKYDNKSYPNEAKVEFGLSTAFF